MKKSELKKIIKEELLKEASNKEAEDKVKKLIMYFIKTYKISPIEAVDLIVDSLNKFGWGIKRTSKWPN